MFLSRNKKPRKGREPIDSVYDIGHKRKYADFALNYYYPHVLAHNEDLNIQLNLLHIQRCTEPSLKHHQ
jgi:hypothetical protein